MHEGIEIVIARLQSDAPKSRAAEARALLRELLAKRCGLPPAELRFVTGAQGKPALAGSRWQFSLSRGGGYAAFAFASERPVGVDIEPIQPFADADAIAERVFPRSEREAYAALAAGERPAGFFRGWTRTEALAKALGGGLTLPTAALDAALAARWIVRSFTPAPGFAGAFAVRPPG